MKIKIQNQNNKYGSFIWQLIVGVILISIFPYVAQAEGSFDYHLLEAFPGFYTSGSIVNDLPSFILAIYKFGIWTIAIAGLFMLVIGGFMYMSSAGNNSLATNAKGIIADAVVGIIAAMCAYLILYVINPDLTKIDIKFSVATVTSPPAGGGGETPATGTCVGTNAACCKSGTTCTVCSNCSSYTNNYSLLCYKGAAGNTGCQLNTSLIAKINNANLASVSAQVSEAWPPTVTHSSPCHANGTCADIRCNAGCKNVSVAAVKAVSEALKKAGFSSYTFESNNCAPYTAVGIPCHYYPTMTSPSFHVNN